MRIVLLAPLTVLALLVVTQAPRAETTGSIPRDDSAATEGTAPVPKTDVLLLNEQEKAKIRAFVTAPRTARLSNARFPLDIGAIVPRSVRARMVPPELAQVHPALRGYAYVVVGDDLVIIEPGTSRIVAVISV
jgi:hypothetical protein